MTKVIGRDTPTVKEHMGELWNVSDLIRHDERSIIRCYCLSANVPRESCRQKQTLYDVFVFPWYDIVYDLSHS
jgi:hypothetical protein